MVTKKKAKLTHKLKGVPIRIQLAIVTGAVCLLALFGAFIGWLDTQVNIDNFLHTSRINSRTFGDVIIRGKTTCLKHRAQGAQAEECALGITTPSGDYAVMGGPAKDASGSPIEVHGLLSAPSPDTVYDVIGVISVQ